jgi:hypothetical protein
MPEQFFRYVRCERAAAWEATGWQILSGPLQLKPPGLEGSSRAVPMMIVEWTQPGDPIEPPSSYGVPGAAHPLSRGMTDDRQTTRSGRFALLGLTLMVIVAFVYVIGGHELGQRLGQLLS